MGVRNFPTSDRKNEKILRREAEDQFALFYGGGRWGEVGWWGGVGVACLLRGQSRPLQLGHILLIICKNVNYL